MTQFCKSWHLPSPRHSAAVLTVVLAVLIFVAALQVKAAALSPQQAPKLPSIVPPRITAKPVADTSKGRVINTVAGWQIISFPATKVRAVSGVTHLLYAVGPFGYVTVDPVAHPEALQAGLAYIAYFEAPSKVRFVGVDIKSPGPRTKLYKGWNLIGCPDSMPIDSRYLTLTDGQGQTALAADVASQATEASSAWIYSQAYAFTGGKWQVATRQSTSPQPFTPGTIGAVFCWKDVTVNWNFKVNSLPKIGKMSPSLAVPGETAVLKGKGFGKQAYAGLTVDGQPVPATNILLWNDSTVKFRVPATASTGKVRVIAGRLPSNAVNLTVLNQPSFAPGNLTPSDAAPEALSLDSSTSRAMDELMAAAPKPQEMERIAKPQAAAGHNTQTPATPTYKAPVSPSAANATKATSKSGVSPLAGRSQSASQPFLPNSNPSRGLLVGQVTSSNGSPISGARVILENSQMTVTDSQGQFQINNIPSEKMGIAIVKPGYNKGRGTINIAPGQTKTMKVSLSPSNASSTSSSAVKKPQRGNFTVTGRPFEAGQRDRRFWVKKIEVSEDGNGSKHWSKTWWNDTGDAGFDLNCDEANLGKSYNIEVTWTTRSRRGGNGREKSNKWTEKFTRSGQTFNFYHP